MGVVIYNLFSRHFIVTLLFICKPLCSADHVVQCRSGLGSEKARLLYLGGLWKLDPLILSTMFEKAVILCFLTRYVDCLNIFVFIFVRLTRRQSASEYDYQRKLF